MYNKTLRDYYNNCKDRGEFNKGRKDRREHNGSLSANGSYLNGYYFEHELIKEKRSTYYVPKRLSVDNYIK